MQYNVGSSAIAGRLHSAASVIEAHIRAGRSNMVISLLDIHQLSGLHTTPKGPAVALSTDERTGVQRRAAL
jgi:hypothetical protein